VIAIMIAACSGSNAARRSRSPAGPVTGTSTSSDPSTSRRPNIVYVLTDDLSLDLVRHMPAVLGMERRGVTFDDYFVSDSLCCPSRSSIFTGDYPHDTGVYTNIGSQGGITAFYRHRNEYRSFDVYLQRAGYVTAFMGKYLNGYLQGPRRSPVANTYVPPGWDTWDAAGYGYDEFNYDLNENGHLHHYGHAGRDYLTSVLAQLGTHFVRRASASGRPFFLELATFTPHQPYVPAPRDRNRFAHITAPEPAAFNRLPLNPPQWLAGRPSLTASEIRYINGVYRRRVQDVQSIDRLINRIREALRASGQLQNTYLVFSSDNGLHTGEYRLLPGKLTAFDTDIHVPLVIDGPGVRAAVSTRAMTENIDLAPTFEQIAGTSAPCDGHSLTALLHGGQPAGWRNAVLVEHRGPDLDRARDPDAQNYKDGNPISYEAMRTPHFLYVEYRDGEREFYDLRRDPDELDNTADSLTPMQLATLHSQLGRLRRCHGRSGCWAAEHVASSP
jgi:N-acetylglucosamine-6-sulfatase